MRVSCVAAIAVLGVSLSASAAVSPAIVSAEASDQVVVRFVVRTTNDATLDSVRVTISGEEFGATPEYEEKRPSVSPHVLIDLGPPLANFRPILSAPMRSWIQKLAAKGQQANPQWTFQFIAGDQNVCRLSRSFTASEVASRIE